MPVALLVVAVGFVGVWVDPAHADPPPCEWISDSDGDWFDPGNWSCGRVPTVGDDVVIDRAGADPVVTIAGCCASFVTLTNRETIRFNGGQADGSIVNDATGTIEFVGGTNSLSGTDFDSAGTVRVQSDSTANLVFEDISQTGLVEIVDGWLSVNAFTNEGVVLFSGTDGTLAGGTVTNASGGLIEATGTGRLDADWTNEVGGTIRSPLGGSLELSLGGTSCGTDADCDDGRFCNGAETCVNGACQPGAPPCSSGETCDEGMDRCVDPTGDVFALTTDTDTITATIGSDTFDGSVFLAGGGVFVMTLNNADVLDGGEGTDTLVAQLLGGGTVIPASLAGIEVLDLEVYDGLAKTFDALTTDAVTTVNNNYSQGDLYVSNLPTAPTTIGMTNTNRDFTVTVDDQALTGSSDAVTLTVAAVADAGANPVVTIQPDAAGNGFETINIVSQGAADNAIDQLTDGNGSSLTTLTVSGSAALTIQDELDSSIQTIDAGSATDDVRLAPNSTGVNTTFTGGSGDDRVDFSGSNSDFNTSDTVDGGGGTDTLLLNGQNADDFFTALSNVSNIEVLEIDTAPSGNIDTTFFGATDFKASAAFGANRLTIPDGGTVELDVDPAGNMTIASKTSGVTNSLTLRLDTNVSNNLVLTSWENLTLQVASTAATIQGTMTLNSSAATESITVIGSQSLTLNGAITADVLDASAMTAALTMNAAPGPGMHITGGNSGDRIIGGADDSDADLLDGGAGNDVLIGGDGDDLLIGGDGADEFVFADTAANNDHDVILDFTTSDVLVLDAFATDNAPSGTLPDTSTGTVPTASNDIWIVTDADGSIDTAAEVAALFGTVFHYSITANSEIVIIIQDTQSGGSSAIWYMDDTGNTTVSAGECVQVCTLASFNGVIGDPNIQEEAGAESSEGGDPEDDDSPVAEAAGSNSGVNEGVIEADGGSVQICCEGTLVNSGALNVVNGGVMTAEGATIDLVGTGQANVDGTLGLEDATAVFHSFSVAATATVSMHAAGLKASNVPPSGASFANAGQIDALGGSFVQIDVPTSSQTGIIVVEAMPGLPPTTLTGLILNQPLDNEGAIRLLGGGAIAGTGTLTNTLGGGPDEGVLEGDGEVKVDLINNGQVAADAGDQLSLLGPASVQNNGAIALAAASTIVIDTPAFTQAGDVTVAPLALCSVAIPLDNAGTIIINGGNLDAASIVKAGALGLYGGQISASTLTSESTTGALSGFGDIFADVTNDNDVTIIANTQVIGDYVNNGTTTIQSGILTITGTLTDNGTITGDTSGGEEEAGSTGGLTALGNYNASGAASLVMPDAALTVKVGGDFSVAIDDKTQYDMAQATLQLVGLGESNQFLELMSEDIGADPNGLDRTQAGHFPLGTLRIGPTPATVSLVDNHDNDGLGQGAPEAIYTSELIIDAGATLHTGGSPVYYETLTNNGSVDDPASLIPIGLATPALASVCPDLGAAAQADRYVYPKAPSVGGLTTIEIQLNSAVTLVGSMCIKSTGNSPPTSATLNDLGGGGLYEVQFSGPIELAEWTTVVFTAENAAGQADICFHVGWLPGDITQDAQLSLADATEFGNESNPKLVDLDGNDQVNINDATKFGQIWNGTNDEGKEPDGTGAWNGEGLPGEPACSCP